MKLKKDKILHIIAGALIYIIVMLITKSVLVSFLSVSIIGGLKEYRDSLGYGCVEFMDFVATIIGGIIGFIIML